MCALDPQVVAERAEEAGTRCPEGLWPLPPQVGIMEGRGREGMHGFAAPSVVALLGHLLVPPALSLQRLHLRAWGWLSSSSAPPRSPQLLFPPCVGLTKSDLHAGEARTGKHDEGPSLYPPLKAECASHGTSVTLGPQLHPLSLCAKEGRLPVPILGQVTDSEPQLRSAVSGMLLLSS